MRSTLLAAFLCATAWASQACAATAPWPALAPLADALRAQPTDPTRAVRLASALAHHDWLFPGVAPDGARWLPGATRGTPALPPLPSPDGRREARWEGGTLRLVSMPEGAPMAEASMNGPVTSAQWHPAGMVLAVARADGIELRDGRTLKAVGQRLPGAIGPALAFSPDGLGLATGAAEGGVVFWDWASGRAWARGCPGMGRLEALAFDDTGRWLRARATSGEVVLETRPGLAMDGWRGGATPVVASSFPMADGRWLTIEASGAVEWKPWEGSGEGSRLLLANAPKALAIDADGAWAAVALAPSKARLWNLRTGLPVGAWLPHPEVAHVAVSQGGSFLWSASPTSIRAHQPVPGTSSLVVSNEPIHAFQGTPSGAWIAALVGPAHAASARVWDATRPGVEVARIPAPAPGAFDIDDSGTWLLVPAEKGGLQQRLVRTPDAPVDRPVLGAGTSWDEARYLGDDRRVVARDQQGVQVWNAIDGTRIGSARVPADVPLSRVHVSPDAQWLRFENAQGAVTLALLASGEEVASWPGTTRRARLPEIPGEPFTTDGKRVVVPDDVGGVRLIPLPPVAPAPAWLANVARIASGTPQGIPPAAITELRARIAQADPKNPWTAWGTWWLAGREARPTSPIAPLASSALADCIGSCAGPVAALEAWRWASHDPARRLALARQMQTNQAWNRPYRAEQGQGLAR